MPKSVSISLTTKNRFSSLAFPNNEPSGVNFDDDELSAAFNVETGPN